MTTSALTGHVTSGGKAVANATVTATSHALQHERVTVTGTNGTYWLGALPPGDYEVTFASKGLQTLTRRAVVELARVARADAQLEPSEDEESVTSTATTISVVHDTALTFHRNEQELDRLPAAVTINSGAYLAPATFSLFPVPEIDKTPTRFPADLVEDETAEELTYLRGVVPLEYTRGGDSAIAARTRSGGEELSVSLRDTISSGVRHFLESASGGRIIPERLWFFGAGWGGSRADGTPRDRHGLELKLTAQLDARQNLAATYIDSENDFEFGSDAESSLLSLVHVAQWSPRLTSEIVAGRSQFGQTIGPLPPSRFTDDTVSAKASFVAGDHVLSGGVDYAGGDLPSDTRSLFVSDRMWRDRWVLNAGLRYGDANPQAGYAPGSLGPPADTQLSAQIAAAYDLRGRGRNAITASATRYSSTVNELTLGYVMALGSTGSARVIAIRKDFEHFLALTSLQLDSSYRLFDRFEAGLNYTYTDTDRGPATVSKHVANAWLSAELQPFALMIAYRYVSAPATFAGEQQALDVALRYTLTVKRAALTFAVDALNALDHGPYQQPRTVRGWIRARL